MLRAPVTLPTRKIPTDISRRLTRPEQSPGYGTDFTFEERDSILRRNALPVFNINRSVISVYSWDDIRKIAPILVFNGDYEGEGSVNDPRMGSITTRTRCRYCFQLNCAGHYGRIEFNEKTYIYNPMFIREIVSILTCICNCCGKLLIGQDIMQEKGFNRLHYMDRLKAMEKESTKLNCSNEHRILPGGPVKACTMNPKFVTTGLKERGRIMFRRRTLNAVSKKTKIEAKPETMELSEVYSILDLISEADAQTLGFAAPSHPRNLIMKGILVIPITIRPPAYEGGHVRYDQFTIIYKDIFKRAEAITKGDRGQIKGTKRVALTAEDLYVLVRQFFFKTENKKIGNKEFVSVVEKIQGKFAIVRESMMGKRNDYSGRTVSSPDPSLAFGQVRIPNAWRPILTKRIMVVDFNIDHVRDLARKGHITHITKQGVFVRREFRSGPESIQIGDQIERFLENGDRVIINRQPTLRKQSMMGYEVVLGKQMSIGLHLSYTSPMNNDFDGDENNCWDPQNFEVEAEVQEILDVKFNVMSTEQNKPIMALVMNAVTAFYLLSLPETIIFSQELVNELLGMLTNQDSLPTLSARLKLYGVHPQSGKALISSMLPPDFYYNTGKVLIQNGILINAPLTKANVGIAHRSIIQDLWKDYGQERVAEFLTDAPRITNKWLIESGFTVGMSDVLSLGVDAEGKEIYKNRVTAAQQLRTVFAQVEALGPPQKDPLREQYRRKALINVLNVAQGIGAKIAKDVLQHNNSIGVMTENKAGTKGSNANVGSIMGVVGQQFYRSEPLKPTITMGTRNIPAYDPFDLDPRASGFVEGSYEKGLTPEEMFFTQMGGRESLMDTALKTSETGNIQRLMTKAMENIIIAPDGSVRNTIGTLFQPIYNASYNIGELMRVGSSEHPNLSSFMDVKATIAKLNIARGWYPKSTVEAFKKRTDLIQDSKELNNVFPNVEPFAPYTPAVSAIDLSKPLVRSQIPLHEKLNVFEKTRIIGTRAVQLARNDPPKVPIGKEIDPVRIATMEYKAGVIDLEVVRKFNDGSYQVVRPDLEHI